MAISKSKNGKAPGFDQVPGEMIKEGGKELKNITYEGIKKLRGRDHTTSGRKYGIICPILKRGDVMMCNILEQ
jgi:hypothetical protein